MPAAQQATSVGIIPTLNRTNGDGGSYRKQKRPGINARELRRVERIEIINKR